MMTQYVVWLRTQMSHKKIGRCDDWDRAAKKKLRVCSSGQVWTEGKTHWMEWKRWYTEKRNKAWVGEKERNDGITAESSGFPSASASSAWVPFSTMCALSASTASCVNEMIRFNRSVSNRVKGLKWTVWVTSQEDVLYILKLQPLWMLSWNKRPISTYLIARIKKKYWKFVL